VLDFFSFHCPDFLNRTSHVKDISDGFGPDISLLQASHVADDKYNKLPTANRKKKKTWLIFELLHSLWSDMLLLLKPKHSKRHQSYQFVHSISTAVSLGALSWLGYLSETFGKKNEEFSKLPFRSNVTSCFVILFYIGIFIQDWLYPSEAVVSIDDDGTMRPSYSSLWLVAINVVGWLSMCGSFFVIYFTPPQTMPAQCREGYAEALQETAAAISDASALLAAGGNLLDGSPGSLSSSSADDGSIPCTGGLFNPTLVDNQHRAAPSHQRLRDRPYVCHRCRCRLPLRSGHCKELNRCVLMYDHYCYFVWSCIHRDNYLYFMYYIVSVTLYLPVFMYSAKMYARATRPDSYFLLYFNIWVCLVWLWVVCLTCYQLQSVYLGLTTRERMKEPAYVSPKNPFRASSMRGNIARYIEDTNFSLACTSFPGLSSKGFVNRGVSVDPNGNFTRRECIYFTQSEAIADLERKSN
jgi:hypothetical protein